MAVRVYVRSPAAIVATLLGALAVGAVVAGGWLLAAAFRALGVAANPVFLAGLGELLYLLVAAVVLAVAAVVWLPFSAAVAYAVGRRVRGGSASLDVTGGVVAERVEPLYRWVKTRLAVGPLAEYLLTDEGDVAPNEIVVGCEKFVIPAVTLDSATLPQAVERANRVAPQSGRQRLAAVGLGTTAAVALAVFVGGELAGLGAVSRPLAVAFAVVGCVFVAAVDTAWRASVYAGQDLAEGFSS